MNRSLLLSLNRVSLNFVRFKTTRLNHLYPANNKKESGLCRRVTPYLHGEESEKDLQVEGVSNKQFPILLSWERPKHIRRWEQHPEGSGDCEPLLELPSDTPILDEYGELTEFQDSPDVVKKILSVEYAKNKDVIERVKDKMSKDVQRHKMDFESIEVAIAQKTVLIRSLQKTVLEAEAKGIPRPSLRHVCKINVDVRRVLLRRLRDTDVKRFEWLLEKLNLVYKPRPFYWERIDRKRHLERLTDLWCEEYKEYNLEKLKNKLHQEQLKYLREKVETLRWMKKEQEELGMEVTVKEEDIDSCIKQANQIEQQIKDEEFKEKEYFIYEPEVNDTDRVFLS